MPGDDRDDTRRTEITITVDVVDDDNVTRRLIAAYTAADPETVWRLLRIALRAGQVQTTGHSANAALVELGDQAARVIDRIETARTQRAPRRGAGQEGPPHP